MFCDVYGMFTDAQFAGILMENIHRHGAMDLLVSDHAQVEISKRVEQFLHALFIGNWQSEPHH